MPDHLEIHMKKYLILLLLSAFSTMVRAADKAVPQFDITWNELGIDENCSMPLGNGDIAVCLDGTKW